MFALTSHRLNPAVNSLFPWLGAFAGAFQEWELRGCLVQLRTESSDIAPAVTLGMYGLAAEYNVTVPAPASKLEVENMENAGTSKISVDLIMPIECARSQTPITHLYVGPVGPNPGDLRLYDHCKIYVFSQGVPREGVKIAELWITYEVAFFKPTITPLLHNQESYSWYGRFEGSCMNDTPLGTPDTVLKLASTNSALFHWDGAWMNMPPQDGQCYMVYIEWFGSDPDHYEQYVGSPFEIVTEGATVAEMWGNAFGAAIVPAQSILSTTPDPESSANLVTSSSMSFVIRLTNSEPAIAPWAPRFQLSGTGNSLPTETISYYANMSITIWNKDFYVPDPDEPTQYITPFPVAGPVAQKRWGIRHKPDIDPMPRQYNEKDKDSSSSSDYFNPDSDLALTEQIEELERVQRARRALPGRKERKELHPRPKSVPVPVAFEKAPDETK